MVVKLKLDSPSEFDRKVFDSAISPDHYLRRVKSLIDFETLPVPSALLL